MSNVWPRISSSPMDRMIAFMVIDCTLRDACLSSDWMGRIKKGNLWMKLGDLFMVS